MKAGKYFAAFLLTVCCACIALSAQPGNVQAAKLNSVAAARQKALQKVPNAAITEVERDFSDGVPVYDVELVKGNKKYDLTYRVSDAKMLEYGWEKVSVGANRTKPLISQDKCKSLAKKQVKNGKIVHLSRKTDDGIDFYKVKMTAGNKRYTLEYHARTGALLAYEWKITASSDSADSSKGYIGLAKAKQIALSKVSGATVVKAEFDMDDGVPVYEIELVNGIYEYEYKIHAKTGKILEYEKDIND